MDQPQLDTDFSNCRAKHDCLSRNLHHHGEDQARSRFAAIKMKVLRHHDVSNHHETVSPPHSFRNF